MAGKTGLPTGTVTFLFSVNGDAALLEELGRTRYAALLAEHERLLTRVFAEHGGKAVDRRPDSVFFAFPSAGGAVTAAVQAQQALAAESRAGIGIHTGEASLGADGYVGFAVHLASRIADLADSGQILLSQTTAAVVEHEHDFAYGLVRQLFEPLLAAASSSERADLLDGPAAPAAQLFDVRELADSDDDEGGVSVAMLHALYWVAANLSLRRPTLLAVDDLHWA